MNDLYSLLERNYLAAIKRGQITRFTTLKDFIAKLKEEIAELEESINEDENTFDPVELVDCFMVCASALMDFKLLRYIEVKVEINEERAKQVMQLDEAKELLTVYNIWRRGGDGEQPNPTKIGIAIDTVINHLNK